MYFGRWSEQPHRVSWPRLVMTAGRDYALILHQAITGILTEPPLARDVLRAIADVGWASLGIVVISAATGMSCYPRSSETRGGRLGHHPQSCPCRRRHRRHRFSQQDPRLCPRDGHRQILRRDRRHGAFNIANNVPGLILAGLAAAIATTFIPAFTRKAEQENKQAAFDLSRKLLTLFTLAGLVLCVLGIILAPWIFGSRDGISRRAWNTETL